MLSQLVAFCYSVALLIALFMPRKYPENAITPTNFLGRFLHEILYYSGGLEPLGNFLLLVPVFLLVVSVGRSHQLLTALIVCTLISVLAEIGQSFIPGRVSSGQDLLLNIGGAFVTMLILMVSRLPNSEPKTSE
jgi:glycopeptide antibiotics resistance protein